MTLYSAVVARYIEIMKKKHVNSLDKLRRPRSVAYSAEQVLLNKQQIWCGGAYLDCYRR